MFFNGRTFTWTGTCSTCLEEGREEVQLRAELDPGSRGTYFLSEAPAAHSAACEHGHPVEAQDAIEAYVEWEREEVEDELWEGADRELVARAYA